MRTSPQFSANLFTFIKEILNGKIHFFVQFFENYIDFLQKLSVCIFQYKDKHYDLF